MKQGKGRTSHLVLLSLVAAVFIWSLFKPAGYYNWALEVIPAVIGLIILITTYNRFRFTTLSYIFVGLLSIIMFVGGHYTYSEVPFFNWVKSPF